MGRIRGRRWFAAIALGGVLAATVTGCAGGVDTADSAGGPAVQQPGGADGGRVGPDGRAEGGRVGPDGRAEGVAPDAPADPAAPEQAGGAGQPLSVDPVDRRSIVYTGSLRVRVDDVDQAASRAATLAVAAGGFVGADQRSADRSSARATLRLRVPAAEFNRVLDEIARLGRQESRDVSTQDVTEETVDLDARIATQRARVANGRRLLGEATSLKDLILLEGELAKREADLASLEARKRRLADLTALSTIVVELHRPEAAQPAPPAQQQTGFLAGLRGGWSALAASAGVLLTVLGALLPWLVALGVPALVVLYLTRRLRRPARGPWTPPSQPTAGTAPGEGVPVARDANPT